MGRWSQFLERVPRAWLLALALALVAGVGGADYFTGYEISFSVFYVMAIAASSWYVGKWAGGLVAVLSVASELFGDMAAGVHYPNTFVPAWNAVIALSFYLVVVWLAASFSALHRELEMRVRQRTTALTVEMAERERLEKELLEISEREQRRIGHDLHDSLCQHLTGTALASQVLEEQLVTKSLPEAEGARRIVSLVEEAIELTRSLARGLYPVALEDAGLPAALGELAAIVADRFQVRCRCECLGDVVLRDITVVTHLYRIAQEALSNAIRHGQARHIALRLEVGPGGVKLIVQDDGRGLPDGRPQNSGMGLRIMAHRATMIGGEFTISGAPVGGTIVTCLVPQPNP